MNIIQPSVEILTPIDSDFILKHLEMCGRTCYLSEDKTTEDSAGKFLKDKLERGHESLIEHYSISVKFICDRGVSHEIVRHRLASYSQESTRYCNYSKDKFNNEITVIKPSYLQEDTPLYNIWYDACEHAEFCYFDMLAQGATPQEARAVLPNSLKTTLIMTANIREWRHFFKMRTSKAAHPQMREIAIMLLNEFQNIIPVLFDDISIED